MSPEHPDVKGHSLLRQEFNKCPQLSGRALKALLELSTAVWQNSLLGFTIYLTAGRSGVFISWLPCLLGKSKSFPFFCLFTICLMIFLLIRYWLLFTIYFTIVHIFATCHKKYRLQTWAQHLTTRVQVIENCPVLTSSASNLLSLWMVESPRMKWFEWSLLLFESQMHMRKHPQTKFRPWWWACSFGTAIYPLIFAFILLSLCCRYPSHTMCHCNILHDTHKPVQSLTHITPPLLAPLPITPLDWFHVLNVHVIYGPHCYISHSLWIPTLFSDDIFLVLLYWFTTMIPNSSA